MEYIVLPFLLLNLGIFYSNVFNKKIDQTLFLGIFTYTFILYLFGLLSILNIGFYVSLVLSFFALIYNIYSFACLKKNFKDNVLTTGLIVFILFYLFVLFLNIGMQVNAWDEFSHWGLKVKNLYEFNTVNVSSDTNLIFDYLSGSSIFQYFCVKLSGFYNESMLYIGMDLIIISCLLPIFSLFKKSRLSSYVLLIMLVFIPVLFYPDIYSSLYVDGLISFVFVYSFISYLINREDNSQVFNFISLASGMGMLIFVKDSGVFFILLMLAIILVDKVWKKYKFLLLSFVPALVIRGLWFISVKLNDTTIVWNKKSFLSTFKNLITNNLLDYQKDTISNFVDAIFNRNVLQGYVTIPYIVIFLVSILLGIVLVKYSSKSLKKLNRNFTVVFGVSFIFYFVLLLFTYISVFSDYEAVNLASFERYNNTFGLAIVLIFIIMIFINFRENKSRLSAFIVCFLIVFFLYFRLNSFYYVSFGARQRVQTKNDIMSSYILESEEIKNYVDVTDEIYVISTADTGLDRLIIRYELTPYSSSWNDWSVGLEPYFDGDIWTSIMSENEFKDNVLENYDYVYLYNVDDVFVSNYGKLFDSEVKSKQLYKVVNDGNYSLKLVY